MTGHHPKGPHPGKNPLCRILAPLGRILPDSLFGRLFLTFSISFLALLIFGAVHASETKQYYMLRGIMSDRARRMADISLLLDTAPESERGRITERLSVKGFTISVALSAPVLDGKTPEDYAKTLERFSRSLRMALEDTWPAEEQGTVAEAARLAVFTLDIPGFTEDLAASWRSATGSRPSFTQSASPLYTAEAAIPLSDGTWAVFRDEAPYFLGAWGLPLQGILMVEVFFMLISLAAFYLIVKPLRWLGQAAEQFGLDLPGTPPLPEIGPKEVREGAQAFNRMQRRIRDFVDERSRALAAVSHDLRTPLTRMRLRVEQLDERVRTPLQKDMDEMQQLMDTTIDLARGANNEDAALMDVAALLESLAEDRQDMGQNVVLLNADALAAVAPLLVRPTAVKRCLDNLLDNAVRYGGSAVTVRVEDGKRELAIFIRDHGPGIPEDKLESVFEAFYRLEPSRNRGTGGSGLGLAIARSMARMHGGDITLRNHPEGGLEAKVTFRRSRAHA